MFGGIEAGGTKFVVGVGSGPDDLQTEVFPTLYPDETLPRVIEFLKREPKLQAVGIGSFGPVDLHRESPTYGFITSTPKAGWAQVDLAGQVGRALSVPVGFDTDVNAALLAEARWGALQHVSDAIYMTVGTGIGGAAMSNGAIVHGLVHTEMGHLLLPKHEADLGFDGCCPYHKSCLEGLASGPAMAQRWGKPGKDLHSEHEAWELESYYLAAALVNLSLTLSPKRIVVGGGVMQTGHLFPRVRKQFAKLLNGYIQTTALSEGLDQYIVPPGLGNDAGVLGAIALGADALDRN